MLPMIKPEINTLIWDLDNTLWDWVTFASKTYPAMRDVLMNATGATRERVTECMQNYYGRAETMESSWLVQDLRRQGLFCGTDDRQKELIDEVRTTFHSHRSKSLALYDGVPEVLKRAYEGGLDNLILSDAPACHAASRIKHLDLDQNFFREMYAMKDSVPEEVPEDFREKFNGGLYGLTFPVYHLDQEKPHSDLESLLVMDREEIRRHVAIIGDSYPKDMALAQRYECLGIYAAWGQHDPELIRIISQFAGRKITARNTSVATQLPDYDNLVRAEHPRDIPALLGW